MKICYDMIHTRIYRVLTCVLLFEKNNIIDCRIFCVLEYLLKHILAYLVRIFYTPNKFYETYLSSLSILHFYIYAHFLFFSSGHMICIAPYIYLIIMLVRIIYTFDTYFLYQSDNNKTDSHL